jgi:uncharacterized protein YjiS (DUF1127 family)
MPMSATTTIPPTRVASIAPLFVRDVETAAAALRTSALKRLARVFAESIAAYKARQAVRELTRLDDRMLRDIGLTRGEIEFAVRPDKAPTPASLTRAPRR